MIINLELFRPGKSGLIFYYSLDVSADREGWFDIPAGCNRLRLSQQDTRSAVSDTESSENAKLKEIFNLYAPELNENQIKMLIRKIEEI